MKLYFTVNKIKADQEVSNVLLEVRLKKIQFLDAHEEKDSPDIIFSRFLEQLEPKKNRENHQKFMSYRQKTELCK